MKNQIDNNVQWDCCSQEEPTRKRITLEKPDRETLIRYHMKHGAREEAMGDMSTKQLMQGYQPEEYDDGDYWNAFH